MAGFDFKCLLTNGRTIFFATWMDVYDGFERTCASVGAVFQLT